MSKRTRGWSRVKTQMLSGAAAVVVVCGGIWMSQHPALLSQLRHPFSISVGTTGAGSASLPGSAGGNTLGSGSSGSAPGGGSAAGNTSASSNVNDPNLQKLQTILDGIAGLQQVALGTASGGGEEVTATISVPVGTNLTDIEDSLIKQYMSDVFSIDSLIETANVYFINGGEFVAGGGLSRGAYQEWAVSTLAGKDGNVETWMSGLPDNSGKVSGWFETASTAPAN